MSEATINYYGLNNIDIFVHGSNVSLNMIINIRIILGKIINNQRQIIKNKGIWSFYSIEINT